MPCSCTSSTYGSIRKPREPLLTKPRSSVARPVPPVLLTGLLTKLRPKCQRAARVGVRQRRRRAPHPAVAVLQLVPAPRPAPARPRTGSAICFGLTGRNVGPPRQAGEVGDVHVRQAGRDLVDVDALDAERRRRLRAVVRLRRERQRAGVAEAELVDEARADDLRVVEGQAVRRQARVLDAGDVGAEVEAGRRLLRRRQTAGRLALRRVELELAVGEADEERVVVRQPVIDAAGDLVLGHLAVRGVQVVVEVARLVRLGVDAGDVAPDRVDAVLRNDVARERIAQELRVAGADRRAGLKPG